MSDLIVLGVDIDDVLFAWYDLAHNACRVAGITNGVTPTSWRPFDDYGCSQEDWLAAVIPMVEQGDYALPPIEGAVEAMHRLMDSGLFEVHLVTSRGGFENGLAIKASTIEWLSTYEIPHHGLHFTQDKTLVRTHISIDDHVRHIKALEEWGVETWLVDRPYNQELDHPRRRATFAEIADDLIHERMG